ncbi:MAG TPA: class I SAM-dependent methyltransferase [Puia sp.]|nr:class I SAM-dependent methyltransferase [Puia sp.]
MKEHLSAQEDHEIGLETLELFAHTDHFNRWLFGELAPYCKGHILEIGSGIGNISSLILERFDKVSLSDLRDDYCEMLRKRFDRNGNLEKIYTLDLAEKEIGKIFPELLNSFDTILTSNVIEHIKDDRLAIRNCHKLLKPGGRLIVLVPAHHLLYNSFDAMLGHYRRYTRNTLTGLMQNEGFSIAHTRYFNAIGVAGWWFSGTILRKKILPENQLALYEKLIPLIRLADTLTMHRLGLSVIAVGEKK